jgi:hypothetical protein
MTRAGQVRLGKVKALLFCKKEAKNFFDLGLGRFQRHGLRLQKFFASFLQKRSLV